MDAIRVIVRLVAKPGSETIVQGVLTELVAPVRRESGCLAYDVYQSGSAPGTFFDIAKWADATAIEAHAAETHVQSALALLEDHLAEALQIDVLRPL